MDRPTCETCVFWQWIQIGDDGLCHKNPPIVVPVPDHEHIEGEKWAEDLWPVTAKNDWCGQHDKFVKWMLDRPVETK